MMPLPDHPDIASAMRTGYPRTYLTGGYSDWPEDGDEYSEEDDDELP